MSFEHVSFSPDDVKFPEHHFVGGEWLVGQNKIPVFRPSDGYLYAQCDDASDDLVHEVVLNAKEGLATSGWANWAPRDRAKVMRVWADLVERESVALARIEALGSTRPIKDAVAWDVPYTAETIRFYAELADKHGGKVAATSSSLLGLVIAEPIGIVAAIAPWNFPLVMATWKVAPALAAGNAVVLKPSELTPFSVLRLAELAHQAGIPEGVFNVVTGRGHTTGKALVKHPLIGKVTFTGSTATGQLIMEECAKFGPKPVTLELGGKSPQIVFADVKDLDSVAATVSRAILNNAGQVCNAGSRLLIERSIATDFIRKLKRMASDWVVGPTWDSSTSFSPIVNKRQLDGIHSAVCDAIAKDAECVFGGKVMDEGSGGAFYEPTLLSTSDNTLAAVQHELFGPVMTVQVFDSEQEAVALANSSNYGLAAGVFSDDVHRVLRLVKQIEAGNIWVNRYGRSNDFILPTGGFKSSGIGKDLGVEAFEANLRHKAVLMGIQS
ncbi:Aldehyde dehydrogenase [Aequoribacter fuscus]|uniref:Aldehyde dehydrogenase n=1 Tax=Aequoribacter fuscus TaxID=2518989 RepID=F3L4Y1_9GAMM|nr:aldehyde dehydrogenase family protein [Aequoribacter fuscus]EGG28622.1 Aldehyde dehydrogenase [Aequoribacter fuscus]QHJ87376.1 aldehyde dehydrogenase [Aequoribacter fuscus]